MFISVLLKVEDGGLSRHSQKQINIKLKSEALIYE